MFAPAQMWKKQGKWVFQLTLNWFRWQKNINSWQGSFVATSIKENKCAQSRWINFNKKKLTTTAGHFVAAFHLEELRLALLALSVKKKSKKTKSSKTKGRSWREAHLCNKNWFLIAHLKMWNHTMHYLSLAWVIASSTDSLAEVSLFFSTSLHRNGTWLFSLHSRQVWCRQYGQWMTLPAVHKNKAK